MISGDLQVAKSSSQIYKEIATDQQQILVFLCLVVHFQAIKWIEVVRKISIHIAGGADPGLEK